MTVVDVYTRQVWLRSLATKLAAEVAAAYETISDEEFRPATLQLDNGKEFSALIAYARNLGSAMVHSHTYSGVSWVEQVNGQVRDMIAQLGVQRGNKQWSDQLENIAAQINAKIRARFAFPSKATTADIWRLWWDGNGTSGGYRYLKGWDCTKKSRPNLSSAVSLMKRFVDESDHSATEIAAMTIPQKHAEFSKLFAALCLVAYGVLSLTRKFAIQIFPAGGERPTGYFNY